MRAGAYCVDPETSEIDVGTAYNPPLTLLSPEGSDECVSA